MFVLSLVGQLSTPTDLGGFRKLGFCLWMKAKLPRAFCLLRLWSSEIDASLGGRQEKLDELQQRVEDLARQQLGQKTSFHDCGDGHSLSESTHKFCPVFRDCLHSRPPQHCHQICVDFMLADPPHLPSLGVSF